MRAILDNNILISALLSPLGAPAHILDAWERKMFTLIVCDDLINELRDVAGRPFFRERLRAGAAGPAISSFAGRRASWPRARTR